MTEEPKLTRQEWRAISDQEYDELYKYGKLNTGPSKIVAALLAIFLGGIGIHKFYLGKSGQGIMYLIFCWTFLPCIIAFFEGIAYLLTSDSAWQQKYGRR